jgi:hypothetical protein
MICLMYYYYFYSYTMRLVQIRLTLYCMLLVQGKNWGAQGKNLQGGEEDQTYVVQV